MVGKSCTLRVYSTDITRSSMRLNASKNAVNSIASTSPSRLPVIINFRHVVAQPSLIFWKQTLVSLRQLDSLPWMK